MRLIAISAIAAIATATAFSGQPVLAADADPGTCANETANLNLANKDTPFTIDAVTTADPGTIDCALKVIDLKREVNVPMTALDVGWEAGLQPAVDEEVCDSPWRDAVKAGWKVTSTWTFADGGSHIFTAACQ